MAGSNKKSILKTIAYADIFDYPMTLDEIWQFLIAKEKVSKKAIQRELDSMSEITQKDGLYCFPERIKIIKKRVHREEESSKKLALIKRVSHVLSFIPTIYLIGISGGLAMQNAETDHDIDLFVVTKKNTLWITRMAILLSLSLLGVRRRRLDTKAADKICLNMLIDETALCFSQERQDLYTAHEVVQMKPIFQRDRTYKKFIKANMWIKQFLPNSLPAVIDRESEIREGRPYPLFIIHYSLFILEWFAKKAQLWYIKKHITKEIVSDNFAAFHPLDYRDKILSLYSARLRRYGI